ncbi:MAG: MBL fold metallo-hydrolase [Thermomicrobiales bacterium]|nr:MBL fold metallo-hydrolase [Thermomicrobiales bacterium]
MTQAPGPHVYFQERWNEWLPFSFYIWIAQGNGRTVVVDTGFPEGPELETLQNNVRKLGKQSEYQDIRHAGEALESIGVTPADVTDVIVTSFVLHSTGGLMTFPNATIHLSARGWLDFWKPEMPHPFGRNVFFTEETVHWLLDRWDRVNLLDEEDEPVPGVRTFWTGCHRRSSTAVSFDTLLGRTVIFEPAFHYGNIERDIPIGGPEALADWHAAMRRGREEIAPGGVLLPQHDPELLQRYPGGIIAG